MIYVQQNSMVFTNGRSCLTNLLEPFESWTEDVEKGYSVDVIFLDFRKSL